jgi:putative acetyltransferase
MPNEKIREFKKQDTPQIIKLITTVIKEFLNYNDNDLKTIVNNLSDIQKNYFDKGGVFIVCELDNKIIGTVALLNHKKGIAKLKRMYLYKKYRGKQYGLKLYQFAENWCQKNKYNKIILSTYPPFTGAKFYEKNGFKKYKTIGKKIFYKKDLK